MPGRLGPRFAIETLFLIALAVGAAYADLRAEWIVLVMAAGWLVVALLEVTSERIWASVPPWRRPYYTPASPPRAEPVSSPPEPESGLEREAAPEIAPRIDTAAAVTMHAGPAAPADPPIAPEPVAEAKLAPEPEREPVPVSEPEPVPEPTRPRLEPLQPRPKRRWFRRREPAEAVAPPESEPPKHVRLLPITAERSAVSDEVAEIFDTTEREGRTAR
jgi:hypothetical protein